MMRKRITEIAIYQYDGFKITDQFCSLINPKKQIQPFRKKAYWNK